MKVYFFAYLRDYANCKETEIGYCPTVEELIHKLCSKYGKKFASKALNGDKLSDEIIILVNGRNILNMNGIKTCLSEDDTISIFPMVAGG